MRRALLVTLAAAIGLAALVPLSSGSPAAAGTSARPKVLFVGDSMGVGLAKFMKANAVPDYDADYQIINKADGACNIGIGTILAYTGIAIPSGLCADWQTYWPQLIAQKDPDVVVLVTGGWEQPDRWAKAPTCNPNCPIPKFRLTQAKGNQRYYKKLTEAVNVLRAGGARVVVVSEPYVDAPVPLPEPTPDLPSVYWNLLWEPYPATPPAAWEPPTPGVSYISGKLKVEALVALQQAVKANEFATVKKVSVFSFLTPLSPGGSTFADSICPPPYQPGHTPCPVALVDVRKDDGYHLTDAGNKIIADLFNVRLRQLLKLPPL
jgi:hypothetical protein